MKGIVIHHQGKIWRALQGSEQRGPLHNSCHHTGAFEAGTNEPRVCCSAHYFIHL